MVKSGPGPRLLGPSGDIGMMSSKSPWKSMMLTGESGIELYPLSGELQTVPVRCVLDLTPYSINQK